MSRLWLFSALEIADCNALRTSVEIRFGLNSSSLRAFCTRRPRMDWATTFSLRKPVRIVETRALASTGAKRRSCFFWLLLLPLGLLVGGVTREITGGREFAELHADHVLVDGDGHMLLAVVDAEGQA